MPGRKVAVASPQPLPADLSLASRSGPTHDPRLRPSRHHFPVCRPGCVATGKVIGSCHRRHRHQEFLKFLNEVDSQLPKGQEVHLVLDNYAIHKTPKVKRWFARHPHYHLHFTPTSASWLNQVERFFALFTDQRIRRGSFNSVPALEKTIKDYLDCHNQEPKPFAWRANADLNTKKHSILL